MEGTNYGGVGGKRVAGLGVLGDWVSGGRLTAGNGKVAGRACPAPTDCCEWVANERGKGGRQPAPFAVGGGCQGMDGDARPVGIPQSAHADSPL